jgi:arginine deiminase
MMAARSDVDPLRRILLHRPGAELNAVDPATADELLFDAPVDLAAAEREHGELCAALHAHGVEVLHLEDLLEEVGHRDGVPPNLMFTRDLGAVIGDGLHVGRMAREVRRPETELMRAVVHAHPLFEGVPLWSDGDVTVEGGDVALAGDGVVLVGVGPRTTLPAASELASRLFAGGAARAIIAALLPEGGPFHLDLAFAFADRDLVVVDAGVLDRSHALVLRPGEAPTSRGSVLGALEDALGHALRVVEADDEAHGRTWDRGTNVLALRPGVVVAYADNTVTRGRLQRAGVEVLPVPGKSLGHGRGGPRCLSCPLERTADAEPPPG